MKIKTKLEIITIILIGIALIGIFLIILITDQIKKSADKVIFSEQITKGVFELNFLADDYLLHQRERSKVQWNLRHKTLTQTLKKQTFNTKVSAEIFKDLDISLQEIKSIFDDMTSATSQDLKERLAAQFLIKSQQLVNDASQLAAQNFSEWTLLRNKANMLLIIFIALLMTISISASLTFYRSVTQPLTRLQQGINQIRTGDLDYHVEIKGNNEFSQLAGSFNEMSAQLKEVDKMKSDFFWMATHQLRTPLSSLKWNIELLLANFDKALTPEVKARVLKLQASTDVMVNQVKEIITVSNMQLYQRSKKNETVDIVDVIDKALFVLEPAVLKKKLSVKIEKEPGAPETFMTEAQQFKDVIQNLLTNAVKYNKVGGTITITIRKEQANLQVVVEDTGIGIPEDDQKNIFTRFFRATNVPDAEGTGLGLALMKMYLEERKGKIWFHSEENKGSTFTIQLPLNLV